MALIGKHAVLAAIAFSLTGAAYAAGGTTGGQFLELLQGSRAGAMGGAFTAVMDDSDCLYYNPAGLATVSYIELPFGDNRWFDGISYQSAGIVYGLRDIRTENLRHMGALAANAATLTTGDIEGRDINGAFTSNFNVENRLLVAGYAKPLFQGDGGTVSAGVSAKFLTEKIAGNEIQSNAFDVGALWAAPGNRVSLGAVVQNLGGGIKYIEQEEDMPTRTRFGGALSNATDDLMVTLDLDTRDLSSYDVFLGGEARLLRAVAIRAGYMFQGSNESRLTAGMGIVLSQMDVYFMYFREVLVEYAFIPYDQLGDTHKIGIKLRLGAD